MNVRICCTLALMLAATFCLGLRAADEGKPKGGGRGGQMAQVLLDHAEDLGLTAEQKTKLQDMAKGPMSVLTEEQKTKAKDLMPKGGGGGAAGKGKKPDAPSTDAPKTEEKKPDAPKADEKKPDAEKDK